MFCVRMTELCRLTGRTKGSVNISRDKGIIPSVVRESDGTRLFDIDDPKVQQFIRTPVKTATAAKIAEARAYVTEFEKRRARGDVKCELTGEADFSSVFDGDITTLVRDASDDELDREKKRKEIVKLDRTIGKMDVQMKAMTGNLMERDYVAAYLRRYLGTLQRKLLDMAGAGISSELFNTAMKHKDLSREGEKAIEVILSREISDAIKEAISTMEQNPI